MKKKISVLITAIGCNTAISVAKALRFSDRNTYKIIGVDMYDSFQAAGSFLCNKHYRIPPVKDETYVNSLIKICKKEDIEIIIPVLDKEVEKISLNKKIFQRHNITTCLSDYETVCNCNDKYKTYMTLKAKGLNIPKVYFMEEVMGKKSGTRYPLFIKPRNGSSSADSFRIDNREESGVFSKRIKYPIVQPYLKGQHCVIDVVNDLSGKNILSVPRYEFSAKAGIGTKAQVVRDSSLIKYAKTISEALKVKGAANIEVFKKAGIIRFIEINPRCSAGIILSVIAGVNIPEIVVDLFMDRKISAERLRWKSGWYMTRYWQEFFSYQGKPMGSIHYPDYYGEKK